MSVVQHTHIFKVDASVYSSGTNYKTVLSEAELLKSARFYKVADQENYLVRKYTLRHILGLFLQQEPASITFHQQANKKPAIANLQFNTSHSKNGIVIAVSQAPIGIDIEYIDPDFDYSAIVQHHFNSAETQFINTAKDPRLAFYTLWTRKEAFLKTTGQGLVDNLSQVDSLNITGKYQHHTLHLDSLQSGNFIITAATPIASPPIMLWSYNG